jgi:hypothetical protein
MAVVGIVLRQGATDSLCGAEDKARSWVAAMNPMSE